MQTGFEDRFRYPLGVTTSIRIRGDCLHRVGGLKPLYLGVSTDDHDISLGHNNLPSPGFYVCYYDIHANHDE